MDDTKTILRSIFERHRKSPNLAFNEDTFLDGLTGKPGGIRGVRNSFRGLARLNAFYDDVQTTFGICLNWGDDQKNWSLDALAAHIDAKRKNEMAQARLVNKRIEERKRLMLDRHLKMLIFPWLIIGPPSIILWQKTGNPLWMCMLLAASLLVVGFTAYADMRQLRVYRQILDKISWREEAHINGESGLPAAPE